MGTRAASACSRLCPICGTFALSVAEERSDRRPARTRSLASLECAGLCQQGRLPAQLSDPGKSHAQEKVTAHHLIESIQTLLPTLERPTVIVLDNASVHRAKVVREKLPEWKQKGLRLLFLPPYCPHLNKIETPWRQMKYRWLAPQDYRDFQTLCQSVTDILAQVGTKYQITFA